MPKKKKMTLSKQKQKEVRMIAKQTTLRLAETKRVGRLNENLNLFHNVPYQRGPFLNTIKKGLNDPTLGTNPNARIGDEITLKSFEQRFWLSNKLDRPNVMYRITTFWFPSNAGLVANNPKVEDVYFFPPGSTLPNVMLLRCNTEVITVISDKLIFSEDNYAQPTYYPAGGIVAVTGKERSQLRTINKNWKGRKVKYLDSGTDGIGAGGPPKNKDIFVFITAYDAYGTLTTDNIASFGENYSLKFKDT